MNEDPNYHTHKHSPHVHHGHLAIAGTVVLCRLSLSLVVIFGVSLFYSGGEGSVTIIIMTSIITPPAATRTQIYHHSEYPTVDIAPAVYLTTTITLPTALAA